MDEKEKITRVQVIFGQNTVDKLNDLSERFGTRNERGEMNMTYTLRTLVAVTHKREFPEYIQVRKEANNRTPEDIARARIAVEDAKDQAQENREKERQEGICLLMDGAEIISDPTTGRPACKYTMYTMSSPHIVDETPTITALTLMNDDTPHLQYNDWMGRTGEPAKHTIREAIRKMKERKEGRTATATTPPVIPSLPKKSKKNV
jgi:hypothetical protein